MKWLTPYTAPLVYAAALLLVAFVGAGRLSADQYISVNVTVTALYLAWLGLAAFGKWRRNDRKRNSTAHSGGTRDDSGDTAFSGRPRRIRARVLRPPGSVVERD